MTDRVNHPSHYTQGGIECIDAIEAATKGIDGFEGYCTGNALKYLWRWKHKNGVEDLKKARWYLDRLIGDVPATQENTCYMCRGKGTVIIDGEMRTCLVCQGERAT